MATAGGECRFFNERPSMLASIAEIAGPRSSDHRRDHPRARPISPADLRIRQWLSFVDVNGRLTKPRATDGAAQAGLRSERPQLRPGRARTTALLSISEAGLDGRLTGVIAYAVAVPALWDD